MASPAPQSQGRSPLVVALLAGLAVAALVITVMALMSRGGDSVDTSAEPTDIVQQLKDAGYKKANEAKRHSDELKRDVVDQTWERSAEPQQVIITDDSGYTTAGVMVVNAVNYRGSDGKGNASCQPDPEHMRSTLEAILKDADAVRAKIAAGVPPSKAPGHEFPYNGDFMGCLP
ncbi:MAG TPA: hypothetical protein VJM46_04445 [Candidatus Saccharimonadales bacterium]|nr:hypothetical protein [Candidatus Saccharimonadales bacterium]